METIGKTLLGLAVALAVVGAFLLLLSRAGVDRLPGDIVFRGRNVTVYVPLGLMILLSVLLTIALNLFWRR
jgi:predicted membrane channel-forming protein YqfA (hemolysin III family)